MQLSTLHWVLSFPFFKGAKDWVNEIVQQGVIYAQQRGKIDFLLP